VAFRLRKQSIHLNATGSQIAEHYFRLMEAYSMGGHRSDFGATAKPDIDGILLVGWRPRICQGFERCVPHANCFIA